MNCFYGFGLACRPQGFRMHKVAMRSGAIGDENKTDLGARGNLFGRNATATQRLVIRMGRNNDSRR